MILVRTPIARTIKYSFMVIVILLAGQVFASDETLERGMLWRIEKAGVASSYLLGTAHVSDPRVIEFKPELYSVLASVDSISLEIDFDPANQMRMAGMMMVPEGRLEDQLGRAYFKKLMAEMDKLQMPVEVVQIFKPWAAALAISLPADHDANQAMDALIYQFAKAESKPFYALETIEEQIDVFETLTPDDQLMFLKLTIDGLPTRDKLYLEVLEAYLESDLSALQLINEESMIMAPPDFLEPLMYALIDKRNQRMLERMQPRLLEGNALVAVGALHLPGDQGLLAMLRGQGFSVSAIY